MYPTKLWQNVQELYCIGLFEQKLIFGCTLLITEWIIIIFPHFHKINISPWQIPSLLNLPFSSLYIIPPTRNPLLPSFFSLIYFTSSVIMTKCVHRKWVRKYKRLLLSASWKLVWLKQLWNLCATDGQFSSKSPWRWTLRIVFVLNVLIFSFVFAHCWTPGQHHTLSLSFLPVS